MDTAALICEEPIPSNRLVVWLAGLPAQNAMNPNLPAGGGNEEVRARYNQFACTPMVIRSTLTPEQRAVVDANTDWDNALLTHLLGKEDNTPQTSHLHSAVGSTVNSMCNGRDMVAPPLYSTHSSRYEESSGWHLSHALQLDAIRYDG